ncbi:hypothetical protein [Rufibacter sp. LB8]|uniref:hypothetical protein n=1 Tax=Rufibacter sp. LB8 TaxID=2777781 RepID=UPI00178C3ED5|nr:hypothetical protein [Rufibacter sp. LB8]
MIREDYYKTLAECEEKFENFRLEVIHVINKLDGYACWEGYDNTIIFTSEGSYGLDNVESYMKELPFIDVHYRGPDEDGYEVLMATLIEDKYFNSRKYKIKVLFEEE